MRYCQLIADGKGESTMMTICNAPHTIFKDFEAAQKVANTLDGTPHEIVPDPKGSGRCIIKLFDEEDPSIFIMNL
jgi:hypothetical protein